jgi:hypothetical protein
MKRPKNLSGQGQTAADVLKPARKRQLEALREKAKELPTDNPYRNATIKNIRRKLREHKKS